NPVPSGGYPHPARRHPPSWCFGVAGSAVARARANATGPMLPRERSCRGGLSSAAILGPASAREDTRPYKVITLSSAAMLGPPPARGDTRPYTIVPAREDTRLYTIAPGREDTRLYTIAPGREDTRLYSIPPARAYTCLYQLGA